ncbi:hypothetical protein [Fusibacillus kribbianus]|uniref:Uncharacterized protein n=1 Tax=Fusibacillus kribbianus TaxID=3044208 RepID=A0AAP4B9S5_9FIRM|nr:hypothetical protein [Ruminococcus sp. YH-rum2234]MDI9242339.1 hypothetical protein [Ruminococcus sp. YH-rum2234]
MGRINKTETTLCAYGWELAGWLQQVLSTADSEDGNAERPSEEEICRMAEYLRRLDGQVRLPLVTPFISVSKEGEEE